MRRFARIVLATLALQPVVAWEASAKPVRWSGNGHLYEVRVAPEPEGVGWVQALLRAQALGCGWYLATITSRAENAFVAKLLARHPETARGGGPWFGGFQKNAGEESPSNWRWVTEEPFAFKNWGPGEPNNEGDEESFMNLFPNGTWNDTTIFGTGHLPKTFVIEFDKRHQTECRKRG